MLTKEFHIGTILSVIWPPHILSPLGNAGIRELLYFLEGEELSDILLFRAFSGYRLYLIAQFPQFTSDEMNSSIIELNELLMPMRGRGEPEKIRMDWLTNLIAKNKFHEFYEVEAISYKPLSSKPHVKQEAPEIRT